MDEIFFTKFHRKIDYDVWILSGTFNGQVFEYPIEDHVEGEFVLPPRCEAYRQIHVANVTGDLVISSQEIKPGVFCANSIISADNQVVKLVNTTDKMVKIDKDFCKLITPLENYYIFALGQADNINRNEKLRNELNLANAPEDCKEKLLKLCNKCNDIFALKTDSLTCNNFYEQRINLTDSSPVYIKNYRTPESQREETSRQIDKM